MTAIIIVNIVLAAAVITGIVGMLAHSIFAQGLDIDSPLAHAKAQRRTTTPKPRLVGRTAENRA